MPDTSHTPDFDKTDAENASILVEIGSVVTVRFPDYRSGEAGEVARLKIVDTPVLNGDTKGLVFKDSPVAMAVLGRHSGETVLVELHERAMSYPLSILAVRRG